MVGCVGLGLNLISALFLHGKSLACMTIWNIGIADAGQNTTMATMTTNRLLSFRMPHPLPWTIQLKGRLAGLRFVRPCYGVLTVF